MTVPELREMKGRRIVCVTAYDAPSARIAEAAGVDLILVGDSVGTTMLGYESTIPVSLEDMERHVAAAARGCSKTLLIADMPFGSYQASVADAVDSAVRLVKAGGAAVKLEGPYTEQIEAIVRAGIPCMGHVGMTPQSVHAFGGHKVQGRKDGERLLQEALDIKRAGAFAVVLELVPAALACKITQELNVPTIGIGAGPDCDGEIQVFHDLLGFGKRVFKHTKRYLEAERDMVKALKLYTDEVRGGKFPTEENSA